MLRLSLQAIFRAECFIPSQLSRYVHTARGAELGPGLLLPAAQPAHGAAMIHLTRRRQKHSALDLDSALQLAAVPRAASSEPAATMRAARAAQRDAPLKASLVFSLPEPPGQLSRWWRCQRAPLGSSAEGKPLTSASLTRSLPPFSDSRAAPQPADRLQTPRHLPLGQ